MLEFDEARARILKRAALLGPEKIAVAEACGRTLHGTLLAPLSLPPFNASAMDGYAVRAVELPSTGACTLAVRGESRAGHPLTELTSGACCRIFTGAPLPAGADAVVIQENCVATGDRIAFEGPVAPWQNVRRRGSELAEGQVGIADGTLLSPFHLGLLASLEQTEVKVARAPRVTFIATGDELRAPGAPNTPGSIAESNSVALKALAERTGARVLRCCRVADDLDATTDALEHALAESDLVVTIGGVSVGDHDVVKAALDAAGVELEFWKVRIKPGKPLAFGQKGAALVLGLPGNPVSAQLTFSLFGLPLLRAMQGQETPLPPTQEVVLENDLHHSPGRMAFVRVRLRGNRAQVLSNQSSGSAGSLSWADGLALAPADCKGLAAGQSVQVLRLSDL